MIFVLISISILFIGIGFCLTEKNVKYMLPAHTMLTLERRKNIDLKLYTLYLRSFHIFMGLLFLIISLSLYQLLGENSCGIFLGTFAIFYRFFFSIL